MLSVQNLSKNMDDQQVLKNISFELPKGSITALLGRNGAGKTTLLQTIVGILDPDQGTVFFNDKNIFLSPQVKESIVFLPDSNALFKHYSVKEIILFYEKLYKKFDEAYFRNLLERFNLPQQGTLRRFSKGMKAMFFIALCFSTKAELIIMDEPTNGLDPIVKRQMLQFVIEEVSEHEVSLLISTHHLAEVEAIADTLLFLKDGSMTERVDLEELKLSMKKIQIAFQDKDPEQITKLRGVSLLQQSGRVLTLLLTEDTEELLGILQDMNPILLDELPISLEDIFVTKLGGEPFVV